MSAAHAAVVLAAGGSARLGRPKQLLKRDGETLVRRAVRLAAMTQPSRLVVVTGAHRAAIEAVLADASVEPVFNPGWSAGIASSLALAAAALAEHAGPTLLLACDQPALEAAHLQQLLALSSSAPSGCAATRHGDVVGIPAVVTARLLARARGREGDRGLGPLLEAFPPGELGRLVAAELEFDVDTPADLAAAAARGLVEP